MGKKSKKKTIKQEGKKNDVKQEKATPKIDDEKKTEGKDSRMSAIGIAPPVYLGKYHGTCKTKGRECVSICNVSTNGTVVFQFAHKNEGHVYRETFAGKSFFFLLMNKKKYSLQKKEGGIIKILLKTSNSSS